MNTPETSPHPRLRLTDARMSRGLSQQDVAEHVGTTYVNVSRWERGITKPSPYFRRKLCIFFGKTEEELDLLPPTDAINRVPTFSRDKSLLEPGASGTGAGPTGDESSRGRAEQPREQTDDESSRGRAEQPREQTDAIHAAGASGTAGEQTDDESSRGRAEQPREQTDAINRVPTFSRDKSLLEPGAGGTAGERTDAINRVRSLSRDKSLLEPGAVYDPAMPLLPAIELVGRAGDLARIKGRLLTGGSVALTALNGLPGVGKTALSITLAHDAEVRAHFRDGMLWAGLGPNPNMPGLLSRWGTLLGISATQMATLGGNEAWAKAIRTAIGARTMLLVIDDAWTLEEALTFRVGGPNCAHLVTTRFPTIASHMTVDGATLIQELSEEESIKLLSLLAPQVVDREVQRAHDLVHAVGGLPLALTLLGNYLRKQAYSGPARRITAALERLSDAEVRLGVSEPHVPVETHPSLPIETSLSLRSVIAVTDGLLSEPARTTLYALAILPPKPDSFSEEVALAVAACTIDELDALSDAGLLESTGSDRYHLHQVIADYARLHLPAEAAHAAHDRLLAYVTDYVETHKKDYELLELESSTILAALEIAHLAQRPAELVRATCAFAPFLILRGFYPLAEQHLKRAHEAALAISDEEGITGALLYLGQVAQRQGDYPQAEAYFQEGLKLARKVGDQEQICALLNDLGNVTWRQGRSTQAEIYLQEGLSLARQIKDRDRVCGILRILGSVFGSRGDYAQSEAYLQEGLNLARQIGNIEQICILLSNLGVTVGGKGNHAEAEIYFKEGLMLARQIGHREQICVLLSNLGEAASAQEHYAQAENYFREGLILARQIGHREWISALLNNLGLMTRKQGDYIQAEVYLQETLDLARQIGRPQIIANALYEYGVLLLDQQQVDLAEKLFQEMLIEVPEDSQELLALANYGLGRVAAAKGNILEARRLGEVSTATLEAMGNRTTQEVKEWLDTITN